MQANAYKEYLKEKKFYQKQLEEETNRRLERIKQKEIEKEKPTPQLITPQSPTPTPTPPPVTTPSQSEAQPETKQSYSNTILKYATFGLWKNERKI